MSSDRRLAASVLLGSFEGPVVPDWLLREVGAGLGGVLLFGNNIVDDAQVSDVCATLRAARADVLIAIDEEGGDVTRLDTRSGSETPCPAAFGFVDDTSMTTDAYAALGRRVADLGIDLTLAPCADINSNPANPIIGVRSFGATPDVVSRHAAAAVSGFRAGGVGVCVKHYPGHGDTTADTHVGRATIGASMALLDARELAPFSAAIAVGADAVLTAHIVVPAVDDQPVSLSAKWTSHLRHAMGFGGVIVTDALDMDGVAEGRGIAGVADAAVRAAHAGADLLCLGSKFDEAMTTHVIGVLAAAIADGRVGREALGSSAARIASLRRATTRVSVPVIDGGGAAERVARQAIVVDGPLPRRPYSLLECRPRLSNASFDVAWGIADRLAARGWATARVSETNAASIDAADPLAIVVRDASVHTWQADLIARCAAKRPDLVVIEMGWPGSVRPACGTYITTHGAAGVTARALVELLNEED
jgi:beta-N-acetylhexosaminidase